MKTPESIRKEGSRISAQDRNILETTMEEIKSLLSQPIINEEMLQKLSNILITINSLRDNYIWRVIRATKQNHMLD
tara:strand:+ start:537 stop:764 length:228 start_codon:yes stop_codon:yes gene_type:complete